MLHYWNAFWDLRVDECPCDVQFTNWLDARSIRGASIFHFGTGGHHHVGVHGAMEGRDNAVYGITASPQEYETFVKLVIDQPRVGRTYKTFFGDIYQLDARMLPEFDVVTLFHLCEFRSEKNDAYDALTDEQVTELLLGRLRPGGYLLFYTKSFAFDSAEPIIDTVAARHGLVREDDHDLLRVYRKP